MKIMFTFINTAITMIFVIGLGKTKNHLIQHKMPTFVPLVKKCFSDLFLINLASKISVGRNYQLLNITLLNYFFG